MPLTGAISKQRDYGLLVLNQEVLSPEQENSIFVTSTEIFDFLIKAEETGVLTGKPIVLHNVVPEVDDADKHTL